MQQYLRTPGVRVGALVATLALLSFMLFISWPTFARADTSVSVGDSTFSPKTITIAPGDTVTWTNTGSLQHTVTADDGLFGSGTMMPGNSFTRTFNTAGSFPYYCQFHGGPGGTGMSGTVIVDASLASSTASAATSTTATSTASTSTTTTATSTSATTTAPVLSSGSVTPNNTGATISWSTDVNSDAQVSYGLTSSYGATTPSDGMSVMSHSVTISGLNPNTLYHFMAMSNASGVMGMSPDMTFRTTTGTTSTSTPSTSTSTPSSTTTPPVTGTTTTTGTTTPYYVDLSVLRTQIAQLDASIRALQVQLQIILVGTGTPGGGTPPPYGGPPTSGEPAVYADDYSVTSGTTVHIHGNGFGPNEQVAVYAGNALVGHAQTGAGGTFTMNLTAPSRSGDTTYSFRGQTSGRSDSLDITLVSDNSSDSDEE